MSPIIYQTGLVMQDITLYTHWHQSEHVTLRAICFSCFFMLSLRTARQARFFVTLPSGGRNQFCIYKQTIGRQNAKSFYCLARVAKTQYILPSDGSITKNLA